MIGYNLYYEGRKLNTRELNETEMNEAMKKSHIYKVNHETNEKIIIPTNKVQCIRCVIV